MPPSEFVLSLPSDYVPAYVLRHLGRDPKSPTEHVEGSIVTRALLLDGSPSRLEMELAGAAVRCRVEGSAGSAALREAQEVAHRLLGLAWDTAGFERHAEQRGLGRLVEGRRGLRMPMTADPFEGLVWVIVGQQVNLAFAYALRRVVIELAGEDAGDGMRVHPTAEAVATLDYADLTRRQFSRRKAEYVIDTARAVVSGELPLEAMAGEPATVVERRLLAVRGLGPWSAGYLLMRAYGFADALPVGDAGLTAALARFHALDHRPGPAETRTLMEPFSPFRTLAAFHLWTSLGDPA
ncbi:MAG TPA: hypothetical protein VEW03_09515 [Longimicrobiaceae bacterium]|nr:hypothetical protein [Longimicrobiaceae bacterium]